MNILKNWIFSDRFFRFFSHSVIATNLDSEHQVLFLLLCSLSACVLFISIICFWKSNKKKRRKFTISYAKINRISISLSFSDLIGTCDIDIDEHNEQKWSNQQISLSFEPIGMMNPSSNIVFYVPRQNVWYEKVSASVRIYSLTKSLKWPRKTKRFFLAQGRMCRHLKLIENDLTDQLKLMEQDRQLLTEFCQSNSFADHLDKVWIEFLFYRCRFISKIFYFLVLAFAQSTEWNTNLQSKCAKLSQKRKRSLETIGTYCRQVFSRSFHRLISIFSFSLL